MSRGLEVLERDALRQDHGNPVSPLAPLVPKLQKVGDGLEDRVHAVGVAPADSKGFKQIGRRPVGDDCLGLLLHLVASKLVHFEPPISMVYSKPRRVFHTAPLATRLLKIRPCSECKCNYATRQGLCHVKMTSKNKHRALSGGLQQAGECRAVPGRLVITQVPPALGKGC
jgi:hypothetical protein